MAKEKATQSADPQDPRWGGYLPWFIRYGEANAPRGDFDLFFERVAQRLDRTLLFNDCGIDNPLKFAARLETETLQRFKNLPDTAVNNALKHHFMPETLHTLADVRSQIDPEELAVRNSKKKLEEEIRKAVGGAPGEGELAAALRERLEGFPGGIAELKEKAFATKKARVQRHYERIIAERLTTLETFLQILPQPSSGIPLLVRDLRRAMAESGIPLNIDDKQLLIVPLEEPLLQREVLDHLLPRLSSRFPDRATELVKAYHDLLQGVDGNTVFGNAFKTLEAIAQDLTKDKNVALYKMDSLTKYFPKLHPTIHGTIIKLAGHRGDEGGHGRNSPDPYEMRYLLFTICNIALLLLEYPDYAS